MSRVRVLVEGVAEDTFVREQLAPVLLERGHYVTASYLSTAGSGVPSWDRSRRALRAALRGDAGGYVTTMVAYYGMPADWPGRVAAPAHPPGSGAAFVE